LSGVLFVLPGLDDRLAAGLLQQTGWQPGELTLRQFPDGETYLRVMEEVTDRRTAIVCPLHQPDHKIMPLLLLAATLRDLGAQEVGLIVPYLPYMRQDHRFKPGEGITSHYFADLLSAHVDWLITVDPHLHRIHHLEEVYSIPALALTAVEPIAAWISSHLHKPLVIGPDSESQQWAERVAQAVGCPWEVLEKVRYGDRHVEVSLPHVEAYAGHTAVLVDDIISTGKTMIQAARHLQAAGLRDLHCIAVHGIFAEGALAEMQQAGLKVVTSNSIPAASSQIDLTALIASHVDKSVRSADSFM
jgi:ribose-phosphate pyrophosphokinase